MKRALVERNIVIFLFVAVLIIFTLAQRDSKKLDRLYTNAEVAVRAVYLAAAAR